MAVRVEIPLALYEKISIYRRECRYETRSQAVIALLAAGLNAATKPSTPQQFASKILEATASPPDRSRKLVPYAGKDARENGL
jgi:hypothetical protein